VEELSKLFNSWKSIFEHIFNLVKDIEDNLFMKKEKRIFSLEMIIQPF
jgi:hypothetical protein